MKSILIHAWALKKKGSDYYLPYTHIVYLREIVKYYDSVCLLAATGTLDSLKHEGMVALNEFPSVSVKQLPNSKSYLGAVKFFFRYYLSYKELKGFDVVYARYPVPFGWLQKIFFSKADRIIHFVGDPIDAAKTNSKFSWLKKQLLIAGFLPEHFLYVWACRGARVFTNGAHLAKKLNKYGVEATPVISSTLNQDDFFSGDKGDFGDAPKLIYIGYLRPAKGIETVIRAFKLLLGNYPNATLSIVGSGESEATLKTMAAVCDSRVKFFGHVDDREYLNSLMREHDIFCFASLSEGSPRVILEAMANQLNVVSTPVGSLPDVFTDKEEILFADFSNEVDFHSKLLRIIEDKKFAFHMRKNAASKVKEFTIENFLREIFYVA